MVLVVGCELYKTYGASDESKFTHTCITMQLTWCM
jgi:hypothetical protein